MTLSAATVTEPDLDARYGDALASFDDAVVDARRVSQSVKRIDVQSALANSRFRPTGPAAPDLGR